MSNRTVTFLLTYSGPVDWVNETLRLSWLSGYANAQQLDEQAAPFISPDNQSGVRTLPNGGRITRQFVKANDK